MGIAFSLDLYMDLHHRANRDVSLYKGIRLGIMKYIGQAQLSISSWDDIQSNGKSDSDSNERKPLENMKQFSVFLLQEEAKNLEELLNYSKLYEKDRQGVKAEEDI